MSWLHPTYFWALAAVPLAALLFLWAAFRRRQAFQRFGQAALVKQLARSVRPRRRGWKAVAVTSAVLLMAIALAGPRFGTSMREVERQGVDLIIALDVSTSMQAEDVAPNRLKRAKKEIKQLLGEMTDNRVGLIIFAGDAFIQCPLTSDYSAVRLFLDVAGPSMLPTPGTNFGAALRESLEAFESADTGQDAARSKAVLFVSDGENHEEGLKRVVRRARQQDVELFATGVGETDGAPIPIHRNGRQVGYKKDRSGQIVQTRLHEQSLRSLAGADDYFRIARTTSALPNLISALERLEQTTFDKEMFAEYEQRYQWPLILALLLLLGEGLVSARRRTTTRPSPS